MKVKDVALKAGVSLATVSRVMNNSAAVAAATREKVMKAIKELRSGENGDLDNSTHRKTGTIGVISINTATGVMGSEYYRKILSGVKSGCELAGYDLIISCKEDNQEAGSYLRLYYEDKVDGLILICFNQSLEAFNFIDESSVPCILIGTGHHSPARGQLDKVKSESFTNMNSITKELISQGHSRFAFIKGPTGLYDAESCYEGFEAALKEHGLEVESDFIFEGSFDADIAEEAVKSLMRDESGPRPLICSNDLLVLGVIGEATRLGLNLPEDLILVGNKEFHVPPNMTDEKTLIGIATRKIGQNAIEQLIKQIDDPELKPASKVVHLDIPHNE